MILGNSNGNNKGKKYRKEYLDEVLAVEAEVFNKWISQNLYTVICFLKKTNIYDEDVLNDTYEKIYEKILYSGFNGSDYRSYLYRAYYTNYVNSNVQNNRFTELLPIHDNNNIDTDYFAEIEKKQSKLEADIMDYIYSNYELREYEIFKMYVNLKPAVNYKTLAKITGLKYHHVQTIIAKIKMDVKNNEEFSRRRNEML